MRTVLLILPLIFMTLIADGSAQSQFDKFFPHSNKWKASSETDAITDEKTCAVQISASDRAFYTKFLTGSDNSKMIEFMKKTVFIDIAFKSKNQ